MSPATVTASDSDIPANVSELRSAIDALDARGALNASEVGLLIEEAVLRAYRRAGGSDPDVRAHVDLDNVSFELYRTDENGTRTPVVPPQADFARQAAESARAAVARRIRETERDTVVREMGPRCGHLADSLVKRRAGDAWHLTVDGHDALLPLEEQIPGEQPTLHGHLKVLILDVHVREKDAVVVVSRSHPQLVRRLLEHEVPELLSGQIEVRAISREAGRRTKIAVASRAEGVDAPGACIGPRGVRHRAVVSELGGEQVQIIAWSEDPAEYVASALTPATVNSVELDDETNTAHITVPTDQLSLAIGRSGENARLTARLTGWRIDIRAFGETS